MKITEKNNTLVNISNSILKYYDIETFHDSYKKLDDILSKNKNKKLCLILLDGFGKIIYEKYKDYCPFLYSHIKLDGSSIYPPTTVAATTSLMTGKYPCETGFLGWDQNFKDLNKYVTVFLNKDKVTGDDLLNVNVQKDLLKPTYITSLINEKLNKDIAGWISSFNYKKKNGEDDLSKLFEEGNKLLKEKEFLYIYSGEPDHSMHMNSMINENTKKIIVYLNNAIKKLVNENKDTLFILLADHGFIDIETIYLNHDLELLDTLKNKDAIFSIEGRFASFEVKEDKINDFINIYNKKYKDKFILKTKDEIIKEEYFGTGNTHKLFNSFLGNYFLLSNSKYNFASKDSFKLKASHAGITEQELELNVLIFND